MKEHHISLPHDGRRAFNGSICEFDNSLWLAYRVSYDDKPDRLRLAELHPDTFAVIGDSPLPVPLDDGWGAEDPRLFVHDDALHVAYTCADYRSRPWVAVMRYGRLSFNALGYASVDHAYQPRFGFNHCNQREKNWQFWSAGGCLFAQYGPSPQRVIQLYGDEVIGEWRSPGFDWGYGYPSGGTPPIPSGNGSMITFFHSFVECADNDRIYSFAAMEFAPVTPFDVRRVSTKPILTAHAEWPRTSDNWSPLCVFPSGAIPYGDGFLVSAGINDCGVVLFEISREDMHLDEPQKIPVKNTGYFRTLFSFLHNARVRTVGEVIEMEIKSAAKLLERNWIQPYES